jgi:hypothetical protein
MDESGRLLAALWAFFQAGRYRQYAIRTGATYLGGQLNLWYTGIGGTVADATASLP